MGPSVPPPAFSAPANFSPGGSDNTPVLPSMKIEVPKFDGSDPNGCIFRVQEFFDFHATPDPLRLPMKHGYGKHVECPCVGHVNTRTRTGYASDTCSIRHVAYR